MDDSHLVNSSNEIEIIKRGRGKVLFHDGFQYYLVRKYKNSQSVWRCKNFRSNKCSGTVTVSEVRSILNSYICTLYVPIFISKI